MYLFTQKSLYQNIEASRNIYISIYVTEIAERIYIICVDVGHHEMSFILRTYCIPVDRYVLGL